MKLLAEIRALFFSQGIGGLPADEFNAPGFDSLWHEGAQLDGIALLALCLPDNVADDLAQCLRVSASWAKRDSLRLRLRCIRRSSH
jgi:hypothetical protein